MTKTSKISCDVKNEITIFYYDNGTEKQNQRKIITYDELKTDKALVVKHEDGSRDLYYFESENGLYSLKKYQYATDLTLGEKDTISFKKKNGEFETLKDVQDEAEFKTLVDGIIVDKNQAIKEIEDLAKAKAAEPKPKAPEKYAINILGENGKFYLIADKDETTKTEIKSATSVQYNYQDGKRYKKFYFENGTLKIELKDKDGKVTTTDLKEPHKLFESSSKDNKALADSVNKLVITSEQKQDAQKSPETKFKFEDKDGQLTVTCGIFKMNNIDSDTLREKEYHFETSDKKKYKLVRQGKDSYKIYLLENETEVTEINAHFQIGQFGKFSSAKKAEPKAAEPKTAEPKTTEPKAPEKYAINIFGENGKFYLIADDDQTTKTEIKSATSVQYNYQNDQRYKKFYFENGTLKIEARDKEGNVTTNDLTKPLQLFEYPSKDKEAFTKSMKRLVITSEQKQDAEKSAPTEQPQPTATAPSQPAVNSPQVTEFVNAFFKNDKKVFTGSWSKKATRDATKESFAEALTHALSNDSELRGAIEGLSAGKKQEHANKILYALANIEFKEGSKGAIFVKNDRAGTWQTIVDFITCAFRAAINFDSSIMDNFFKKNPQVIVKDVAKLEGFINHTATEKEAGTGKSMLAKAIADIGTQQTTQR